VFVADDDRVDRAGEDQRGVIDQFLERKHESCRGLRAAGEQHEASTQLRTEARQREETRCHETGAHHGMSASKSGRRAGKVSWATKPVCRLNALSCTYGSSNSAR